jgi:hypothetical protein
VVGGDRKMWFSINLRENIYVGPSLKKQCRHHSTCLYSQLSNRKRGVSQFKAHPGQNTRLSEKALGAWLKLQDIFLASMRLKKLQYCWKF